MSILPKKKTSEMLRDPTEKKTRQEVYDSIMLGNRIPDEDVFQSYLTTSPFGEVRITLACDSLAFQFQTYQRAM